MTNRYEWLDREIAGIPRRKFLAFEARSLSALDCIERRYGPLPSDYRDFVQRFGEAKLYRSVHSLGYNLMVWAPPMVTESSRGRCGAPDLIRIRLGHQINTGYAWLEWSDGVFLDDGAIFVGLTGKRRRTAASFKEWLRVSSSDCRTFYSKEEWQELAKPVPPFSQKEQCIVDSIPRFGFKRAGVTTNGNLLVEVENRSSLVLRHLTVGVRDKPGMTGSTALSVSGIGPGDTRVIEQAVYKGAMNPQEVELFSLPIPDPEDRLYYKEFLQISEYG